MGLLCLMSFAIIMAGVDDEQLASLRQQPGAEKAGSQSAATGFHGTFIHTESLIGSSVLLPLAHCSKDVPHCHCLALPTTC